MGSELPEIAIQIAHTLFWFLETAINWNIQDIVE